MSPFVNVALHQTAWQSSDYLTYTYYSASFAVDGYKLPLPAETLCAATAGGETSPSWTVDLVDVTYVYGVNLTNRADCCTHHNTVIL